MLILCILGDPDQSIYSWRFAKPQLIDEIMKEFQQAQLHQLEQNYRSTKHIIAASVYMINQGKGGKGNEHTGFVIIQDILYAMIRLDKDQKALVDGE
jgi:superfamily I DNA/RNA helicase